MEEIRNALARTSALALSSSGLDADAGAAAFAQAAKVLHQAHGALQVVDIAGASLLTEAVEDLLTRAAEAAATLAPSCLAAIAAACGALTEYLDELLAGAAPQALKLYPYYRDLQQARGIGRIHPTDLYFPDLSIQPRLAAPTAQASAAEAAQLRQRFEKALLPLLKSSDPHAERASAAGLAEVLAEFVRRPTGQYGRAYWWVLHAFASGVASGEIASAVYVKQLFGRINMQMRKLDEPPSELSERVMRDALYFIATAPHPSPRLQQIRQVYGLAPVDEAGLHTGRYGRIDQASTASALERLQSAKTAWERLAAGETQAAADFQRDMDVLATAAASRGSASLDQLLAQLAALARTAADSTSAAPGQELALDVAAALLFLESVLGGSGRQGADTDQTAAAMTARLAALASGDTPSAPLRWSGSATEDAGQRETVAALAGEMRSNLAQVEKLLDEFFSNSAKRTVLAPVDAILHQIEGALAILDQHQALLAVRNVRAEVAGFAAPEFEGEPGRPEFQHVARNLGALSFFLESLQADSEAAKTRFSFDAGSNLFSSVMTRRGQVREVEVPVIPAAPVAAPDAAVAERPADASGLPMPSSADASANLQPARQDTGPAPAPVMPAEPPAAYEDQRALANVDLPEAVEYAPAAPSPVQPSDLVLTLDDEAVDAELLEIFLGEAVEVLETVSDTLPSLRMAPVEQDYLTTLRRAFHTLKGSGRMVGLGAFGEAAWGMEKTLNLALAGNEPASDDLCNLIDRAHDELSAWVDDLQRTGKSARTPHALVHACELLANGGELPAKETTSAASPADSAAASAAPEQADMKTDMVAAASPEPEAADEAIEEIEAAPVPFDADNGADLADADADDNVTQAPEQAPAALAQVFSFPDVHLPESRVDDSIKRIGTLEISVPLHNIYLAETDDLVRLLAQDLAEWRHEAWRSVNTIAVHAAHSLAGSSATVGFMPLQEVAYALERVLQTALPQLVIP
jgi:chemosensory pili system protein ChpA (sensor histidine kinase/response regulator)